ncbi:MAG: hypothetical protein ACRDCH_00060 [Metamycoplasmataceae bacterium]
MINNLKALNLGMMSVTLSLIPLAVVTSCGSTGSVESPKIDYKISTIDNPQLIMWDIEGDNLKKLSTLSKVFNDLNSENIRNLNISINPVDAPSNYQITLSAKEGYSINEQKILKSNLFKINDDLKIEIVNIIPTDIKASDIEGNNFKNFQVLAKLFNGADFIETNLPNLIFEKISTANINSFQIKISPIDGVTINGSPEGLTSLEFTLSVDNLIDIDTNKIDQENKYLNRKIKANKKGNT